jgi:2-hydroxychromene-2-carboxylate isomerase
MLWPKNIHVAHLVIDAGVDTEFVRGRIAQSEGEAALANLDPDRLMRPDAVENKLEYEKLELERFLRRHQITAFRLNPFFPINTLTLMRGAVAAQRLGVFQRYVDEIYRHMWVDPKKMDDPEVLRTALEESGLDSGRLLELTQDPDVKSRLMENTRRSVELGSFGAPTFYVGSEIFFGKDRLRDVEEALAGMPCRMPHV